MIQQSLFDKKPLTKRDCHHQWLLDPQAQVDINPLQLLQEPVKLRPKGRPHGSKATFSHDTSTKRNPSKYELAAHKRAREMQALSHHEREERERRMRDAEEDPEFQAYMRAFENRIRAEQAAGTQVET